MPLIGSLSSVHPPPFRTTLRGRIFSSLPFHNPSTNSSHIPPLLCLHIPCRLSRILYLLHSQSDLDSERRLHRKLRGSKSFEICLHFGPRCAPAKKYHKFYRGLSKAFKNLHRRTNNLDLVHLKYAQGSFLLPEPSKFRIFRLGSGFLLHFFTLR